MLKKIIVTLSVLICFSVIQAQNVAILISLKGEGSLKKGNSKEEILAVSRTLQDGDLLKLSNGKAVIMYFNGQEVELIAGESYTVKSESGNAFTGALYAMTEIGSGALLSQSGSMHSIRGLKHVYPSKSKYKIGESASFIVSQKFSEDSLSIEFADSKTLKKMWVFPLKDSVFSLDSVSFEIGKTYHWTVKGLTSNMPELGTVVIDENQPIIAEPQNKLDYLNAITLCYRELYVFKALEYCNEAKQKFPEITIFNVIYANMLE
ncbi:MAG: hypothetical protein IPO21_12065 [Bacteroidales bacterium]|nr:hypothetical protein [Bacteroidales bacterium]